MALKVGMCNIFVLFLVPDGKKVYLCTRFNVGRPLSDYADYGLTQF